jgi:HEAT repeat protein
LRTTERWETRATIGHILEAVQDIDPSLVSVELIDELSRDADFSVRSSAAMLLYLRALSAPGDVPIDLLALLAGDGDWYVFMPGMSALQEVALTREEAMERLDLLAQSPDRDVRSRIARAVLEVAEIKPSVIPPELVKRRQGDEYEHVRSYADEASVLIAGLTERERRSGYYRFGPF